MEWKRYRVNGAQIYALFLDSRNPGQKLWGNRATWRFHGFKVPTPLPVSILES